MKIATRIGAVASAAALTLALTACSDSGTTATPSASDAAVPLSGELNGAGASSQEKASEAWRAEFQNAHPAVTLNYDPVGSGGGRTQFLDGAVSYAGSDSLMSADEYATAVTRCDGTDGAIHLPVYISPIAILFNLEGISSLNMSPDVIAQVFDGQITKWDDAAIVAENPGVDLPNLAITVVHRSDESGTTKNFTDYLAKASEAWPYDASGEWANNVGEGGQGTSGVIDLVTGTNGTIGYADASRAGALGAVSIKVGDDWVPFSPAGAAAAVSASPLAEGANGANDLAYKLDRTTTADGAYPLVLVSYVIMCQQYDDAAERALVTSYLKYVASDEGQNVASAAAGSSPIGPLGTRIEGILDEIAAG
ncbi:MAG: phosphate ABC transporter substrate-binding protein PstS [Demequinaceae bacterium]|nr:phosphate ABC transporter substrate-binding protein PstS [Demequinaceae bacterium]